MALAPNSSKFFSLSLFCTNPPNKPLITTRLSSASLAIPESKLPASSLRISTRLGKPGIVACSNGKDLEESFASSSKEVSFDLKLPRRSLIVQFTCNACGERTQRTINRVAYERGTVFVQCAGCRVNHKLVDNLGLVVEYDLREEIDADNAAAGKACGALT